MSTTKDDIPIQNILNLQENTFSSPLEMEGSLKALLKLLSRTSSPNNKIPSYLIDQIEVIFEEKYIEEKIWADFSKATLIICAPKRKNESKESLNVRRQAYLINFSVILDELKTRALSQVYRTLTSEGKKKLIQDFNKKQGIKNEFNS